MRSSKENEKRYTIIKRAVGKSFAKDKKRAPKSLYSLMRLLFELLVINPSHGSTGGGANAQQKLQDNIDDLKDFLNDVQQHAAAANGKTSTSGNRGRSTVKKKTKAETSGGTNTVNEAKKKKFANW